MKYYSDVTKEFYESVEACETAEKEHEEAIAKAKAEKEAKEAGRRAAAKDVEEALKAANDAYEGYREKLADFNKRYGAWHYSISGEQPMNVFDFLMKML